MNVVLLRVGIDTGCYCGIHGPLFRDWSFEYIPLPDYPDNIDNRKYGTYQGRKNKPLIDYFPRSLQSKMRAQSIHLDPEFDTYTYGDPTRPKQSLSKLQPGDMLVFYCGLQGYPPKEFQSDAALYPLGYFEVEIAGHASKLGETEVQRSFEANFHVLHPTNDRDRLVLVKGGKGSRQLTKAVKISSVGKDRRGSDIFVLSREMREHFGTFTRLNAIQRSNPRWVKQAFVKKAADFVRSLE